MAKTQPGGAYRVGGKVVDSEGKSTKLKATQDAAEETGPEATDAAAKLAEESGIDLASIKGTGADGRIVVDDVEAAIEAATKPDA